MSVSQKACIIIYTLVIIQCAVTIAITYYRAKRTWTLYSLTMAQILVILWLFFGMVENMSETTVQLLFSIRFTLIPICFIGGVWLLFALFYAGLINKRNKGIIAVIFFPLMLTYLPALTNKYFYLILIHKSIENPAITQWGGFFRINCSLTYVYIILSTIIIVAKSLKDYQNLQKKTILIILASIISATVNIITSLKLVEDPGFDLTPVSFALFFLLMSISIFKFNLINLVRHATVDIFQNTEEAILILDNNNYIIEYNKNTEKEFKFIKLQRVGHINHIIEELKSRCTNQKIMDEIMLQLDRKDGIYHTRLQIMAYKSIQFYDLYIKNVWNDDGEAMGKIVSFKNITDESESLIESERYRISGDIHDNLSNMINVVSMNLEYALKHYDDRKVAEGCIQTAYDTAKGIRINLRRILEELAPIDIEKAGILNALESLFNKVSGTELKLEFTCSGIDEKAVSASRHGYVIYKTCMEALNNSFFSGKAKRLEIVLIYKNGIIRLFISDDGHGCSSIHKGRGLTAMEERVHSLGGNVSFDSAIGEGFNIAVDLTFNQEGFYDQCFNSG